MPNPKSIFCMAAMFFFALFAGPDVALAQCPEEPPLQNYTGGGTISCPCFVEGEEAGAVLNAPPEHYPLEILRIGIGWGSQFGGSPAQIEYGIHVYDAGLPDPGTPVFSLLGPQLVDGVINEFDIEPLPGEVTMDSGPFTVTLEFLNTNAGDPFAPTVVHDGNGCQAGKNVVFAIPGGWYDACDLGVTGDWVFYVIYKPCVPSGIGDGPFVASTVPAFLQLPRPNPFESSTEFEFVLAQPGRADIAVYDVSGRRVARIVNESYPAGAHRVTWEGRDNAGKRLPSGVYFVKLQVGDYKSVRKVLIAK
ncbi:MAG: T9SS type A sorting domain-containing protein [Candidatus Latescibacteria bacterium]|nr:T9SS type A sorting domain-containing protein [Candidatus Latescibacterota bacterium]NIO57291.1 T9SS type A sorting domain-containing protein [Candidatus Latescibacterota bacterium]